MLSFIERTTNNENTIIINTLAQTNQGCLIKGTISIDDEINEATASNFCCGVAGYPEKHYEAVSLDADMAFLKRKVNAGANFIVTQMFFDNTKYFNFVKRCSEEGINIPIFPGIKPLTNRKQLVGLSNIFNIEMPQDLTKAVNTAKDEDVKQIGLDWCVQQCKELKNGGVPVLHFYTMGLSEATKYIAQKVF